jgi:hypothetical protein
MELEFLVTIAVNDGALERDAQRRQRPIEAAITEAIVDLECRLHDAVRYRDGVERIDVTPHSVTVQPIAPLGERPGHVDRIERPDRIN